MWTPVYFVRLVSLPASIEGVTVPNDDGTFDIYLNAGLCEARQKDRLRHEIRHIVEDHFYQESKSVAQLEQEANGIKEAPPPRLPNVFIESPPGMIPYFSSLEAFQNYMYAMKEQIQRDKLQRSAG